MNKRRFGAVASYAYSVAQIAVNLVYVPLLLTGVGQAEYGLYQMIGSVIAYLNVINSTISAGATRFFSKYYVLGDEDGMANVLGILRRAYRKAGIFVALGATALMFTVRIAYAGSFTPWEVTEGCLLIAVLALNLVVTMNNTLSIAVISAHEEFAFLKLTMLVTTVVQPFFVLAAIRFFPYALTVSLVQLACNTVCRTAQHLYAERRLGMDSEERYRDEDLERALLSFSGSIVLGLVADQVFWKTDQLVLGYLFGTSTVAVYSVGMQVVNAYSPLGLAVSSVFLPRVSRLWHREKNLSAISNLFIRVSRVALYPLLAVLIGFIVFGRDFVLLWAGEGYGEAYWVAVIVLFPFTVDVVQNIGLTILQVMNLYGFRARMYVTAAIINIFLTVFLAQEFGCIGAALSSGIAITMSSGVVLNWYYARRVGLAMGRWWLSIIREAVPLVVVGAIFAVVWSFAQPVSNWGELVAGIAVYAAVFFFVAYFLCADEYEKDLIRGVLHKFLKCGE